MRNFDRIAEGIDVAPLRHAIIRNSHLWGQNTFRTTYPNTPHADVSDIWLRFSDPAKCLTVGNVIGDDRPIWQPAAAELPQAKPLIRGLMNQVNAYELGRVLITRLAPGGRILLHADKDGDYVQAPDRARYHVVIQGLPGSLYHCGDDPETRETVCMHTGEVWWFNAHQLHEVVNNSGEDRIHLLVDVRTW